MDIIFLGLEQAYEQNRSQAEKDKLMKYANLALKIMRTYARVFTTGEPVIYRYKGWIEWFSGKREKAYQSWRTACEKAQSIPMYYEGRDVFSCPCQSSACQKPLTRRQF